MESRNGGITMSKRISTRNQMARAIYQDMAALMVTYGPTGGSYATTHGVSVSAKLAKSLLDCGQDAGLTQGELFLAPNDDGLFPGFTQTWRAL